MRPIQSFTGVSWGLNNEISKDQWNCGTHRRKTHLGFGNQVSPHPVPTWTQSYAAISVTELSKRDIPLLKSSNFKSSALRLILSRSAKVLGSLLSREFLFQKRDPTSMSRLLRVPIIPPQVYIFCLQVGDWILSGSPLPLSQLAARSPI